MRFVPSLCTDMCCVFFVCKFYGFNEHKKNQIDHDLEENHLSFPKSPPRSRVPANCYLDTNLIFKKGCSLWYSYWLINIWYSCLSPGGKDRFNCRLVRALFIQHSWVKYVIGALKVWASNPFYTVFFLFLQRWKEWRWTSKLEQASRSGKSAFSSHSMPSDSMVYMPSRFFSSFHEIITVTFLLPENVTFQVKHSTFQLIIGRTSPPFPG